MAESPSQVSVGATRIVVFKRPGSPMSTPTRSKKSKTSTGTSTGVTTMPQASPTSLNAGVSTGDPTIPPPSSSTVQPTASVARPNPISDTNNTNVPSSNTRPATDVTPAQSSETAALLQTYCEVDESFSSLMKKLQRAQERRKAYAAARGAENAMFLSLVEESLIRAMNETKDRLEIDLVSSWKP